MIIHTGSRTDIPACYSRWFYNRIREGTVMVRNPYYPQQVTKYRLSPDVVDCLIFCTKNPEPMISGLDQLNRYRQLWFVTITPYGKEIERNVPYKNRVMESFCRLSEAVGKRGVRWRYDPIFVTDKYSAAFHVEKFEEMAERLHEYTDACVISFIDLYEKTKKNFPGVREVREEERLKIGEAFARVGERYGITVYSCCEGNELEPFGVNCSGCMTKEVIEDAIGERLSVPKKGKPAREGCSCLLGGDIGAYNTCTNGCVYCYANYDQETVKRNRKLHDENSAFLIGREMEEDEVREAKQESWLDGQLFLPL